jgi:citrate lyase subunit beta / citryl-CoA lyase
MDTVRSLLFVPGDSDKKIAKAQSCGADALILDLEDAVAPQNKPAARKTTLAALQAGSSKRLFVRINAIDTPDALLDLDAIVAGRPYGIMVPKCRSSADVAIVDRHLSELEARHGLAGGAIKVLPISTETAASLFGANTYSEATPRLCGLLWGGEDLAADIGATANRDADGRYLPPYAFARTLCLLSSVAARVAAVDAVYTDFRNPDGLRAETRDAVRDGFTAKAAIHPDQAAIINEVFTPTPAEIERAQRVVDAFAAEPDKGVVALDGRMLDRPHLIQSQRLLRRARLS